MATHRLGPTPATVHWGYLDAKIPPRLTVDSGDTVTVDTVSGGLADVGDTSIMLPHHREICEKLKPSPGPHILTGPIAVRGAEAGDTLEVRIKAIQLMVDWGWNLIRPLRGTLPEDYPEFRCRIIPIDRAAMTCKPFTLLARVGEPCGYAYCQGGTRCGSSGVCEQVPRIGESCSGRDSCLPPAVCVEKDGGVGVCRVLDGSECPR